MELKKEEEMYEEELDRKWMKGIDPNPEYHRKTEDISYRIFY